MTAIEFHSVVDETQYIFTSTTLSSKDFLATELEPPAALRLTLSGVVASQI